MSGVGSASLRKFLRGERLTRNEAILAKCCECCGGYVDGRVDCVVPRCPLRPYMPYALCRTNSGFTNRRGE